MITVTEGAAEHLKDIATTNSKTPKLGVRGGGCAGFSYDWGLVSDEEVLKDDETIYLPNGGKLVLDGTSMMFLFGSTVDLKKNVFGTVLEITTPAAQSSCGCGESINFDMEKVEANSFQLPK
jgi:iron-sulfur cluster assembly accessory protein|tara:strand:+ start:3654 stop:4019 length:366 start_codon:yes stop_codon:yes gene_type:complete